MVKWVGYIFPSSALPLNVKEISCELILTNAFKHLSDQPTRYSTAFLKIELFLFIFHLLFYPFLRNYSMVGNN